MNCNYYLIKKLLVILLLTFSINAKSDAINVMTLNIHHNSFTDMDNSQSTYLPWRYRKNGIYSIISNFKPDIIGLQEDSTTQRNDIVNRFRAAYDYAQFSSNFTISNGYGSHGTILYNKNKFSLIGRGEFNLLGERNGRWIKLRTTSSAIEFYVFNIHWFGTGNSTQFENIRKSMAQNTAYILWNKTNNNNTAILLGDFNSFRNFKQYDYLVSNKNKYSDWSYHTNHRALSDQHSPNQQKNETVHNINSDNINTYLSTHNGIDHILTSNSLIYNHNKIYSKVINYPPGPESKYATDHPAIMSTVYLDKSDASINNQSNSIVPIFNLLLLND